VARTRESIAVLACNRGDNKLSRSFPLAVCLVLFVRFGLFWLTGPGIPLDSFMRLREDIDPIANKIPASRKRKSFIGGGGGGGCGGGWSGTAQRIAAF